MRLYLHAARCPIALRVFLDNNPDYWCFIPLLRHEAETQNLTYFRERNISRRHVVDVDTASIIAVTNTGHRRVAFWLDRIPLPPAAYAFSYEQRHQQRAFFQRFLPSPVDQLPYSSVDVFKVAMIAVRECIAELLIDHGRRSSALVALVPDDRSRILRYVVQTLFSVQAETKLNMICPLSNCPERLYGRPFNLVWCESLHRPFVVPTLASTRDA